MTQRKKHNKTEEAGLYSELKEGLNQIIQYESGKKVPGIRKHKIRIAELPKYIGKEIKEIRENLAMTQSVFSKVIGVSQKTVEAWEVGRNIPQGPAQRVLMILAKDSSILERLGLVSREKIKKTG